MLHYRPVLSRLRSRLTNRTLIDAAVKTVEICRAKTWPGRPALYLPDELDRVTGHMSVSDPRTNFARLAGEPLRQGAAHAYLLRDIIIADGTLLSSSARAAVSSGPRRWRLPPIQQHVQEGAFCSTQISEQYFGHWLTDVLSHELWAHQRSLEPLVLPSPSERLHEPGYRELTELQARVVDLGRIERCWVLEDHELTASRVERIEQLRGRIRAKVNATGPSHVYIGRGFTGSTRSLQNEAEVVATLEARGFAFVSPESSSPREICDTLANARVIASIEGSAMTHALLASPRGATLVAITPPWRMNAWLKSYADVLGMRYAVTVGDNAGEGCFTQPIDRLERLLDLVEQTAPA